MIHVCYGIHDKDGRYSKFAGTSILSMLENYNTPPPRSLTIHILHDNTLTLDNIQKFVYIAGQYNQIVKFYNVEKLFVNKITEIRKLLPKVEKSAFSLGSMYRFLAVDLLLNDTPKIIYIDSDTIVNLDIRELWQIDVENVPLAAVTEIDNMVPIEWIPICREQVVKHANYFNSGVLLMNLNVLKANAGNIYQGINFISDNPQYPYFDQDVLNYCFSEMYLKLPIKFNQTIRHLRWIGEKTLHKKIYHYNASYLNLDISDAFNRLFLKYFIKTTFFSEDSIGHLYEGTRQIYIEQKNFATQISAMMSGKTRAFFIASPNTEICKHIFYINADEEYIVANSPESLQKMIQSLRESVGKKIFFIFAQEYAAIRQILMQQSFVEGRDFLNAAMFLSDAHGVPLNSHKLVELL